MQQRKLRWLAYMDLEGSPKRGISLDSEGDAEIKDWSGSWMDAKFVQPPGHYVRGIKSMLGLLIKLSLKVLSSWITSLTRKKTEQFVKP